MQIILPIVGFFLLGFITRRLISDPNLVIKWINNFIVFIALPALILLKVPQLHFSPKVIVPASIAWAWLVIGSGLVLAISKWQGWPKPTEGAVLLLVILGNSSFLGYPMVLAFFNDAVLAYAIFYDQLGNFIIFCTVGLFVIAKYSPSKNGDANTLRFSDIILRVLGFPPFIALLVAAFLPVESFIEAGSNVLNLFASPLMPLALFVLGIQFQPRLLPEHRRPLITAITLKMLVAPAAAAIILAVIGSVGNVRIATIFEIAMPCMVTPGLIAINAGIAPRFIATLLGYSTVFAFITLPLIAWMIG